MTGPTTDGSHTRAVRRATPDDAGALARLRLEFRASVGHVVEDEVVFVARCADWMSARLADGPWRAWLVEEIDGQAAGNIWLQVIEKIPNPVAEPELHGYVTNFFVRPDARNAGTGARLMEALLKHCDGSGVDAVFLWPTVRSVAFYERHGFTRGGDVMVRRR